MKRVKSGKLVKSVKSIGRSSNGRTVGSDPANLGSNPSLPTIGTKCTMVIAIFKNATAFLLPRLG